MALREDRIGQTWLVPRRVTDFIPENHVCYFITNLVEELDFKTIDRKYRHTRGKGAYSRRMLLRIVIMAGFDVCFLLGVLQGLQRKMWFMCIFRGWINLISGQFVV